jgi:anti-sigma B factor antagonist
VHDLSDNSTVNPVPFEIRHEVLDGGVHAFAVRGELDLDTAPELESALEAALAGDGAAAVIDLGGCEFIDSTGIALLVSAWRQLEGEGGGRLVLCCLSDQVRRLLEITGVESSISMHAKREDALAALRG